MEMEMEMEEMEDSGEVIGLLVPVSRL